MRGYSLLLGALFIYNGVMLKADNIKVNLINITKNIVNEVNKEVVFGNTTYYYELVDNVWFNYKTVIVNKNVRKVSHYAFSKKKIVSREATPKNGSILMYHVITIYDNAKLTKLLKQQFYTYDSFERLSNEEISIIDEGKNIKIYSKDIIYHDLKKVKMITTSNYYNNKNLKNYTKIYFDKYRKRVSYYRLKKRDNNKKISALSNVYRKGYIYKSTFYKYSYSGDFKNKSYKKVSMYDKRQLKSIKKLLFQGNKKKSKYVILNYRFNRKHKQVNYYYNRNGNINGNASKIRIIFNKNGKPLKVYFAQYNKKGRLGKFKKIKVTKKDINF